ncbi:hypothetical protein FP513_08600 [Escherichia coli]|nr:hypothetical protein FP513_08600 [Escherichia coli]
MPRGVSIADEFDERVEAARTPQQCLIWCACYRMGDPEVVRRSRDGRHLRADLGALRSCHQKRTGALFRKKPTIKLHHRPD